MASAGREATDRRGAERGIRPFIPAEERLPELTWLPLLMGTALGVVFGASSLYLVLKTGLTVSASIPIAVISMTLFRLLARLGMRPATILENNIVQTAGSAGESIAFGFGATMPAILILGFDLEILQVLMVGVLGGLLGILMMIPMRRALIVQQHGVLKFPEGTACAEVLKAGADETSLAIAVKAGTANISETRIGARTILTGFGIGLLYKSLMSALRLWKEVPERVFGAPFRGGSLSAEISPELLGVGYIIGPRIAGWMVGGGILAYLVLIPLIQFFGDGLSEPLAPGSIPIREMGPHEIRGAYLLYIGAGSVAAAGILSMLRSIPMIWTGVREGLRGLSGKAKEAKRSVDRTDQDLPLPWVIGGILVLLGLILAVRSLQVNLLGALAIVVFGFLFVTVSARLTGEVGSSSNPISGMTVATLLLTCLIFVLVGWTTPPYYVTALSIGAIVCIASSNGGTIAQSLKTGHLLGATPQAQQVAILFGSLASALLIGPILTRLNDTGTVYLPVSKAAEQSWQVDPSRLRQKEGLRGPQASQDSRQFFVWRQQASDGTSQKYLVDDRGVPVYRVDPGINGTIETRPDGTRAQKFDAPKATLMSYIIKGILGRQLPWALVLIGVMITLMLEASGIPSLAFAVGVYLPLSTSTPIFLGGVIRWGVDRWMRRRLADRRLSEEEFTAETDKSPGVLLASGYIAGGAIAGIVIAFLAGVTRETNRQIEEWATQYNPFYSGAWSDLLALLPFALLCVVLYLVGRNLLWRHDEAERSAKEPG